MEMTDTYYPPLELGTRSHLETVRLHLMEDPAYLQSDDCPYPDELRAYLGTLLGDAKGGSGTEPALSEASPNRTDAHAYSAEDLETEVERLFAELEEFGNKVKDGAANEQASYFRVAAALVEKILAAKERAANLKEFGRLVGFLMQFAEDNMDIDTRTKFMDGLKAFSDQ